jgi:hypothetical protein
MSANALLDRLRAWERGAAAPCHRDAAVLARRRRRPPRAGLRAHGRRGVALGRRPRALPTGAARAHRRRSAQPRRPRGLRHGLRGDGARTRGHPVHVGAPEEPSGERVFPREVLRRRQLWVPGPTHLEMLHLLDFRYTLAATGDEDRLKTLRAFGRACGWLFRESTRPGQVRVHDATARLRDAYVFPAEPVRQRHLGYLLAWLGEGRRRRAGRPGAGCRAQLGGGDHAPRVRARHPGGPGLIPARDEGRRARCHRGGDPSRPRARARSALAAHRAGAARARRRPAPRQPAARPRARPRARRVPLAVLSPRGPRDAGGPYPRGASRPRRAPRDRLRAGARGGAVLSAPPRARGRGQRAGARRPGAARARARRGRRLSRHRHGGVARANARPRARALVACACPPTRACGCARSPRCASWGRASARG